MIDALEQGQHIDLIGERITQKRNEKKDLAEQLAIEKAQKIQVSASEIMFFLARLRNGDNDNIMAKKALVSVLINKIYLFDDHFTIFFNTGSTPTKVDISLLEKVSGGSYNTYYAPPNYEKPSNIKGLKERKSAVHALYTLNQLKNGLTLHKQPPSD